MGARISELDDDVCIGVRYTYTITKVWGVDASLAWSPSSATEVPGDDIRMDVWTLDLDAMRHAIPEGNGMGYIMFGAGWTRADLDRPIVGEVAGQSVSMEEDGGFTLNAGLGWKHVTEDDFILRFEGRYRYMDALVTAFPACLNAFEATVGFGWDF